MRLLLGETHGVTVGSPNISTDGFLSAILKAFIPRSRGRHAPKLITHDVAHQRRPHKPAARGLRPHYSRIAAQSPPPAGYCSPSQHRLGEHAKRYGPQAVAGHLTCSPRSMG